MNTQEMLDTLIQSIQTASRPRTAPYDSTGVVKRIEDGIAWVQIAGGVDETPVSMTVNAQEGDTVQVRVSGGTAFLVGNATAPPTDDATANAAQVTATNAQVAANTAIADAERAKNAADEAQASADSAAASAASAQTSANNAQSSANAAQVSANNANEYASRALSGLSTVQSVAETLTWITQHGTMTLTTDTVLNPTHVYFVQDNEGDYVVGDTHYSVVAEPSADDLSTYYELSIDESLNNYVATHLALTNEGLWVIPDASGYKVLIATGNGTVYTDAGMYIIGKVGGTETILAEFTSYDVIIGRRDDVHIEMDEDSFAMVDSHGDEFAHLGSPIGTRVTDTFIYSNNATFTLTNTPTDLVTVKINGTTTSNYTIAGKSLTITSTLSANDAITAQYNTADEIKYYTMGVRNGDAGNLSMAEGKNTTASGQSSHAEGYGTTASGGDSHAECSSTTASGLSSHAEGGSTTASGSSSHSEGYITTASGDFSHAEGGPYVTASGQSSHAEGSGFVTASGQSSHAEGYDTSAGGNYSHAQNYGTVAGSENQTAIGKYNKVDYDGVYAFIIGNGTGSVMSRSNAYATTWDGDSHVALDTSAASGTLDGNLYSAINALGWVSEVTV